MENPFPLFIDLAGRPVTVVGGGTVGLRRAAALRDFGAAVTVVAPALKEPLEGVVHLPRPYRPGDLEGAFLVLAAADDPAVNDAVEAEARRRGIPFNRSDDRRRCDFYFPALCRSHGIVAGVAGDGGDHRRTAEAARRIRQVLEELP